MNSLFFVLKTACLDIAWYLWFCACNILCPTSVFHFTISWFLITICIQHRSLSFCIDHQLVSLALYLLMLWSKKDSIISNIQIFKSSSEVPSDSISLSFCFSSYHPVIVVKNRNPGMTQPCLTVMLILSNLVCSPSSTTEHSKSLYMIFTIIISLLQML